MASPYKGTEEYAEGYQTAFGGRITPSGAMEDVRYRDGYEAGRRAVQIFEESGMKRQGNGFAVSFTIAST